jgi:hypothetical protein
MTYQAILGVSVLLLLIHAVERLCRAMSFPSVIALIAGGMLAKPLLANVGITLDWVGSLVPVIGTVGLVLIVLEGALDMELKRDRLRLLGATFMLATLGLLACLLPLAWLAWKTMGLSPIHALLLATPFAVISSAVAIPASAHLSREIREFVVYESSMSDILGVLVFFALYGADGQAHAALVNLAGGGLLSLLLSLLSALALMWVLTRMDGHIRFVPLLAGLFALYATGKLLHLSPLLMVLMFGLLLNNPGLISRFRPFRSWISADYGATLVEFRTLVVELTFAVRGLFFVLLGYWTDLSALASPETWLWALAALCVIYLGRYLLLRLFRQPEEAAILTWMAPRGLITVLLLLTARESLELPDYIGGVVLILVLASSLLMLSARPGGELACARNEK